MQLVININEHLYKIIKTLGLVVEDEDAVAVSEAIRNGTPLLKGHGDLKDINMIYNELDGKSFSTTFDYFNAIDAVDDAPTIVEADTESEKV